MKAKRQWDMTSKLLEKNYHPRILCPVKIYLKKKQTLETFTDIQDGLMTPIKRPRSSDWIKKQQPNDMLSTRNSL